MNDTRYGLLMQLIRLIKNSQYEVAKKYINRNRLQLAMHCLPELFALQIEMSEWMPEKKHKPDPSEPSSHVTVKVRENNNASVAHNAIKDFVAWLRVIGIQSDGVCREELIEPEGTFTIKLSGGQLLGNIYGRFLGNTKFARHYLSYNNLLSFLKYNDYVAVFSKLADFENNKDTFADLIPDNAPPSTSVLSNTEECYVPYLSHLPINLFEVLKIINKFEAKQINILIPYIYRIFSIALYRTIYVEQIRDEVIFKRDSLI